MPDEALRVLVQSAVAGVRAVYWWGSGAAGQLGTNSTGQSAVPVKVVGQ